MRPSRPAARPALLGLIALLASLGAGDPDGVSPDRFFEAKVRPILAGTCQKCHGAERQKGGLRLDSLEAALRGGDSGPAVVPGKLDESLLVEAVHHDGLRMPPAGKLDDAQIADLERWVELGAPWPDHGGAAPAPPSPARTFSDADRAWWAFQPVGRFEPPPEGDGWARNPIDRFVARTLAANGLTPAPEADRRTLIRRVTFDLTGLPPTPEEVEAFVDDPDPLAYEHLVGQLLESPRHGERSARRWLDLVRWAESDGYRADAFRPEAWRYRDYVIDAYNRDTPYDRFVIEQLAGDELDPEDLDLRVATQFLRLWAYEYNQRDVPGQWSAILNDLTDVTADVFLGLGMGCARCHDHKFDPILRRDYYRLQAFYAPLLPRDDLRLAPDSEVADLAVAQAAYDLMTADLRAELAEVETPARTFSFREGFLKFQPDLRAIILKPDHLRTPLERQYGYLCGRQFVEEFATKIDGRLSPDARKRYDELKARLKAFDRYRPEPPPRAFTATDVGRGAPPTVIPGDRRAEPIEPGFLTILDPGPAPIESPEPGAATTGRRLTLARWIARPDNPLSMRVVVNRAWQDHFGRGLVGTPSDFGRLGDPPSHPELLDWLAAWFVDHGMRSKDLHRLIVTSATYRQAAVRPRAEVEAARRLDPENRLLWRHNTARLEAEPIRDAMLAVSGELDPALGGPSVPADAPRRSIYTRAIRNTHDPVLDAFDAPDGSASVPRRNLTTSPTQSLLLINGAWTLQRARAFAERLARERPDDPAAQVDRAYRIAFGRAPTEAERADALAFLDEQAALPGAGPGDALVDLCHAVLNSNEFLYVD
jgi:mono/diheme cytochrome c family protein